jgi:hypothetical protein
MKYFKLDDSENPGYARVKILSQNKKMLPAKVYRVEVIEITKPSLIRGCKVGQKLTVNGILLHEEI